MITCGAYNNADYWASFQEYWFSRSAWALHTAYLIVLWKWKSLSRVWLFVTPCSPQNSSGQKTGVGSLLPSSGDLPNPGIQPRFPTLQVDSSSAESQQKPKNTGVGSLSLSSPADFPDSGIKPGSPALQVDSLPTDLSGSWELNRGDFFEGAGVIWILAKFKSNTDLVNLEERSLLRSVVVI